MLTVDEALSLVLAATEALTPQLTDITKTLDCVLAIDVVAKDRVPPHDKAMMDGYAVVASDRSTQRQVIEEITAGDVPTQSIGDGTVARIMTGAPVPAGADAVVPVERSKMIDDRTVELDWIDPPSGKHVMRAGELVEPGETLLAAGERITPAAIGLFAEHGVQQVSVIPNPSVAILPTGNELVEFNETPPTGSIRNSNGPLLATAATTLGSRVQTLPIARDDRNKLAELIQKGLESDALLLTGGVSAGKLDLVPDVLAEIGVEQRFHKVAMKPGKPIWFGTLARESGPPRLVFGLPGNPVSSFVGFCVFAMPALRRLAGYKPAKTNQSAELTGPISNEGPRELFYPVRLESQEFGLPKATPNSWRGSADIRGIATADALARIPADTQAVAGDSVDTLILPGFRQ